MEPRRRSARLLNAGHYFRASSSNRDNPIVLPDSPIRQNTAMNNQNPNCSPSSSHSEIRDNLWSIVPYHPLIAENALSLNIPPLETENPAANTEAVQSPTTTEPLSPFSQTSSAQNYGPQTSRTTDPLPSPTSNAMQPSDHSNRQSPIQNTHHSAPPVAESPAVPCDTQSTSSSKVPSPPTIFVRRPRFKSTASKPPLARPSSSQPPNRPKTKDKMPSVPKNRRTRSSIRAEKFPRFCDEEAKILFPKICQKSILNEKNISIRDFKFLGLFELLEEQSLIPSLSYSAPYVKTLVHEFYANLKKNVGTPLSSSYGSVFVRGFDIAFSASIINKFLGCDRPDASVVLSPNLVIKELTGGMLTTWKPKTSFVATNLTTKYAILHKIAIQNWLPTTHSSTVSFETGCLLFKVGKCVPFNLGQLIFGKIVGKAGKSSTYGVLPYPSLIFSIIQSQHKLVLPTESYEPFEPPFKFYSALWTGPRVVDLPTLAEDDAVADDADDASTPEPTDVNDNISILEKNVHFLTQLEEQVVTQLSGIRKRKGEMLLQLAKLHG